MNRRVSEDYVLDHAFTNYPMSGVGLHVSNYIAGSTMTTGRYTAESLAENLDYDGVAEIRDALRYNLNCQLFGLAYRTLTETNSRILSRNKR